MTVSTSTPENNKEYNFRAQEAKYEKLLAQERSARQEAEAVAQRFSQKEEVDENDSEPYVDHKKLHKTLAKHEQKVQQQTQSEIQKAVSEAIKQERKEKWLKDNPDFYDTLQHAEAFAAKDPDLAESILEMPEGFERQKLVYKNIKALGVGKPAIREQTIQEKVDANRRSPYYQPSGVGSAPYASQGDFSPAGQKQAFDKLTQLKERLRLG